MVQIGQTDGKGGHSQVTRQRVGELHSARMGRLMLVAIIATCPGTQLSGVWNADALGEGAESW